MRFDTICIVLCVAAVQATKNPEKEKRGAQNYGSATTAYTSGSSTANTTPAPVYPTAVTPAPVYATKIAPQLNYVSQPVTYEQQQINVQQPYRIAYSVQPTQGGKYASSPVTYAGPQQQFSYTFEANPQVKYAFAQPQPQPQHVRYIPQPVVKYAAVQPEVKYEAPQNELKYVVAQPQQDVKYTYVHPATVRVPATPSVTKFAYSAQPEVSSTQPHYSPAGSVSSFSFSSPHVTYSNLGLLSQTVGKGYSGHQHQHQQQQQPQQQVAYVAQLAAAPAAHYVTATRTAPQVQYVHGPQLQIPQGAHTTQQFVYVSPQVNYRPSKVQDARPGIIYA